MRRDQSFIYGLKQDNPQSQGNHRITQCLMHAEKMVVEGKWCEAIRYLMAENSKQLDVHLERAIVDLMLQAGQETTSNPIHNRESKNHPQNSEATLCVKGEIPEIPADELTANILRRGIHHHGHLLVRNFLPFPATQSLTTCIDQSLGSRVAAFESNSMQENISPWYYSSPYFPGNRVSFARFGLKQKFSTTGSMRVIESPRSALQVLELYRTLNLGKLLKDYFGEPPVIATRKWVFRLVPPKTGEDGVGYGWHQDGQFMGQSVHAINLWVALTPCGDTTNSPSIALIPKRFNKIHEVGTHGAKLNWTVGPKLVEKLAGDTQIVRPHFNPGDALFFDHFSLHRSGHAPDQTQNRYALESWFYGTSAHSTNAIMPLL